jgi:hypothetical protein
MSKTNKKLIYPHAERGEVIHPTPERWKRSQLVPTVTYETDADGGRRPVKTLRNANASVTKRLDRCKSLTAGQLMAASLFERDHEAANLDPRMTINLLGAGGGRAAMSEEAAKRLLAARDRKHHALNALRLGGPDVVRVIEDVVLNASTVVEVGKARHANKDKALAWAGTALGIGLHLLESHYRAEGRMAG